VRNLRPGDRVVIPSTIHERRAPLVRQRRLLDAAASRHVVDEEDRASVVTPAVEP
jgi:hypothetical protein